MERATDSRFGRSARRWRSVVAVAGVTTALLFSTAAPSAAAIENRSGATVPAVAATGDYWARIQLTEGLAPDANWAYVTDTGTEPTNAILVETWSSTAGQAWHFVPVVKPGFYNIYQIHTGLDGWCMNRGLYGTINVAPCTNTYAQYWQRQAVYADQYRLASTVTGECLSYSIYRNPNGTIVIPVDQIFLTDLCGYQESSGEIFRDSL
jgi:hypothetical protein